MLSALLKDGIIAAGSRKSISSNRLIRVQFQRILLTTRFANFLLI